MRKPGAYRGTTRSRRSTTIACTKNSPYAISSTTNPATYAPPSSLTKPPTFNKQNQFSLRWRTESEVLSGSGETTCGNTRCHHHSPEPDDNSYHLNTVELPFAYIEKGESKSALVKVVLCDKCIKKLMYKRMKDKEAAQAAALLETGGNIPASGTDTPGELPDDNPRSRRRASRERYETSNTGDKEGRRRNQSRSLSPRERHRSRHKGRRRSRSP